MDVEAILRDVRAVLVSVLVVETVDGGGEVLIAEDGCGMDAIAGCVGAAAVEEVVEFLLPH